MTNSYTNVFGGDNIDPSYLSYASYFLGLSPGNIILVWPFEAVEGSNIAAAKIDVFCNLNGRTISMPNATLVSVGRDILVNNTGQFPFNVLDAVGGTIVSISPGEQYYLYLIDNTTTQGSWQVVLFGSTTSPAVASSLAGFGLRASGSRLDQNLPTLVLNSDYMFTANDRAEVARNNTGAVTWSFDASTNLQNGWMIYTINGGSGTIVLTPNGTETIDGSSTKNINPGESAIVFSDGSNLWTLGYGRAISSTVTGTSVNLAGSGVVTLNAAQVAAQVQNFTGALTGNRIIEYGTSPGYWFVYNNTSGAFSTTFRTNSIDPGTTVAQGSFSIIRSDGTSMTTAFTATSGTVTEIDTNPADITGGPITSTGTLALATTTVIPSTYGDAASTVTVAIDSKGRITSAVQNVISIVVSQIQAFSSAALRAIVTDPTGTGALVFGSSPTIDTAALGSASTATTQPPLTDSTLLATTAYVDLAIAAVLASMFQTGDVLVTYNDMAGRPGWVYATGSIGNAASGATTRANADTLNLFTFLYNKFNNTICPVSGGRGADAATDFAADKTLSLIDLRGVVMAAAEDMGGTSRGNLGSNPSTGGFSSVASIGLSAGEKGHLQVTSEVGTHAHPLPNQNPSGTNAGSTGGPVQGSGAPGNTSNNTAPTQSGNVTQPTSTANMLLKL